MTPPDNEREAERLARKLGGGWRADQTPIGPNPVIVLTLWEAQELEKRLRDEEGIVPDDPF